MARCAFVSFRLGLSDGVSVVAESWRQVFQALGWDTVTVAGEGPVDRQVPGLALGAARPPDPDLVAAALGDVDLVVVENLLTIPMNLEASRVVAAELAGRPALLHHHDPPWQRDRFAHITELPVDDPAWVHVTINRLTADQFAQRGLATTTIYNGFDPDRFAPAADPTNPIRRRTRDALGVSDADRLLLHPVRAIERKNIPAALAVAEATGGVYWLPGPAEDGYQPTLDRLLGSTSARVITTPISVTPAISVTDAYAACDLVLFPSSWEGFGNPPIEAALARRPVVVGAYPVADELRSLGFRWLDPTDTKAIEAALVEGLGGGATGEDLAVNEAVARAELSMEKLKKDVEQLLVAAGWLA